MNTTALAVQALVAAGYPVTATEIVSGLAYLKTRAAGGRRLRLRRGQAGTGQRRQLHRLCRPGHPRRGARPGKGRPGRVDGVTPIAYLLSMQLPDGSFEWQPGTGANLLATAQAVPALLGRSYPLAGGKLESCIKLRQ